LESPPGTKPAGSAAGSFPPVFDQACHDATS
jgi:hypothetical protein